MFAQGVRFCVSRKNYFIKFVPSVMTFSFASWSEWGASGSLDSRCASY